MAFSPPIIAVPVSWIADLENGLDLEQVYKDQDPKFFIERGIKIGCTSICREYRKVGQESEDRGAYL